MPGKVIERGEVRPYRPPVQPGYEDTEESRRSIEQAMREGYEEGLRRGTAEAHKQLESERLEAARQLARALEEIATLRRNILDSLRRETVDLALAAAARMVRARIDQGDAVVERVVAETLDKLGSTAVREIRLHPEDLEVMRSGGAAEIVEGIALVPDESIARGGVLIETADEEVDARQETALKVLRESLLEEK
ncbi:MAG: FliH/SctL family protein [Acidobacteriota bacterium]|nr:FliH/SctL family protein [Acidobacteriota bacterium]MDQ7087455.1 FliH/SctL family protein [Acidobacteriota bacterium]